MTKVSVTDKIDEIICRLCEQIDNETALTEGKVELINALASLVKARAFMDD